MRPLRAVGILSIVFPVCLLSASRVRAAEPTIPKPTPRVFQSACDLGESMAGSLHSGKNWAKDQAEKTCRMLQPTMSEDDAAAFLRCCVQRLTGGVDAPKT